MTFLEQILNCFLPPRCLRCGKILKENTGLCAQCIDEINFITAPYCRKCGHPFEFLQDGPEGLLCGHCLKGRHSPFRYSRSAFAYDDASKNLILNFKFHDKTENAKLLAQMMWVAGRDIFAAGVDVIMPVPLHYTRLLKRRFNQSALLGKELSKLSGIGCDSLSLIRHKKTRPQVELSGMERQRNVRDVFSVKHPDEVKGKRVLLIDDVLTTGATLKECARALHRAGAKSVDTLTAGRVI